MRAPSCARNLDPGKKCGPGALTLRRDPDYGKSGIQSTEIPPIPVKKECIRLTLSWNKPRTETGSADSCVLPGALLSEYLARILHENAHKFT